MRWYENRRTSSSSRARVGLLTLVGIFAVWPLISFCSANPEPRNKPTPVLARSRGAQQSFRALQTYWLAHPTSRRNLENPLNQFLHRYNTDQRARLARVYLAWIHIDRGELVKGRALARQTRLGPAGSAHDFADIAESAILLKEKKPERALKLLAPLRGKVIDPVERLLFGEQYVLAALAAHRWLEASQAMEDWLATAPGENRELVQALIKNLLKQIPSLALERSVQALASRDDDSPPAQRAAGWWLRRAIRLNLKQTALERGDTGLAKRLLQTTGVSDRDEIALARLAASETPSPRIAGRAIGLLLNVDNPTTRRRSTEVARGMSRALGLPHLSAHADFVQLLTRDDTEEVSSDAKARSSTSNVVRALAGLAADGASILVAGVTDPIAVAASQYAEQSSIPLILLRHPQGLKGNERFTFVMGVDDSRVTQALNQALKRRNIESVARIGRSEISCGLTVTKAGQPRFPVRRWKRNQVQGLVLQGGPDCSYDVIQEADSVGFFPTLALGLESAHLMFQLPARRKIVVRAGAFPGRALGAKPSSKEQAGAAESPPSFYQALGRDAAVLAQAALLSLPLVETDVPKAVTRQHQRVQEALATVNQQLWTSNFRGFAEERFLKRRILTITTRK